MKWLTFFFLAVIFITSVSAEVCTENNYEPCKNGRHVITAMCINGTLVETFKNCPEVIKQTVCDQDIELECWDGSIITTYFCVDGIPRETGIMCPIQKIDAMINEGETVVLSNTPTKNNNLTATVIILFIIIIYVYIQRKKKQKEDELLHSQVEDQVKPDIRGESGPDPLPPLQPPDGPKN